MEQRLAIGGNNPPSESEILKQRLDGYTNEEKLINDLVSRNVPEEISGDDVAGELTDFIKSLKSARSTVEKIFKTEKEPFLAAGKVADAWKNVRWLKIDNSITKASKPIIAWNAKKAEEERARQAELARKAQEEAEALAKEAEAHADAGIDDTANDLLNFAVEAENKATNIINKADDIKGRSYGSFGSASTRKVWVGEIEDITKIDLNLLRNYFSRSDIEAVVNRAVRGGARELNGVKIFEQDKLTIR
jgi:hypothetical protein